MQRPRMQPLLRTKDNESIHWHDVVRALRFLFFSNEKQGENSVRANSPKQPGTAAALNMVHCGHTP